MLSASRMARVTFCRLPGQGVCAGWKMTLKVQTLGVQTPHMLLLCLPPRVPQEGPADVPGVWGSAWAKQGAVWGWGVC